MALMKVANQRPPNKTAYAPMAPTTTAGGARGSASAARRGHGNEGADAAAEQRAAAAGQAACRSMQGKMGHQRAAGALWARTCGGDARGDAGEARGLSGCGDGRCVVARRGHNAARESVAVPAGSRVPRGRAKRAARRHHRPSRRPTCARGGNPCCRRRNAACMMTCPSPSQILACQEQGVRAERHGAAWTRAVTPGGAARRAAGAARRSGVRPQETGLPMAERAADARDRPRRSAAAAA